MNTKFKVVLGLVALLSGLLTSCDTDFNSVGVDILGEGNYDFNDGEEQGISIYNQEVGAVQTNNLSINQLGVYVDPNTGVTTTSNFVTQLLMETPNPTLGSSREIDSVYLEIPYVSEVAGTVGEWSSYNLKDIHVTKTDNENTTHTYESVVVNRTNSVFPAMKLEVFRNNRSIQQFDGSNLENALKYYSDEDPLFDAAKIGSSLNNNVTIVEGTDTQEENGKFKPSFRQIVKYKAVASGTGTGITYTKGTEVESRQAPMMRLRLDNSFGSTILDAGYNNLYNNDNFKNFYKGLYFKVTAGPEGGSLMKLDFKKGKVIIHYKAIEKINNIDNKLMKTFVLNMAGTTVNLFKNSPLPTLTDNSQIYLKGGQGTMAVVKLFSPGKIQELRNKKALINDASLFITVDKTLIPTTNKSKTPLRLYLFDLDTDKVIADYSLDGTADSSNSLLNKSIFGGILADKGGTSKKQYRIRLTNHISRIINSDPTNLAAVNYKNVRLGLVITENINNPAYAALKSSSYSLVGETDNAGNNLNSKVLKYFPVAAVMSPMSVKLYGTGTGEDNIKFKIHYTIPN